MKMIDIVYDNLRRNKKKKLVGGDILGYMKRNNHNSFGKHR